MPSRSSKRFKKVWTDADDQNGQSYDELVPRIVDRGRIKEPEEEWSSSSSPSSSEDDDDEWETRRPSQPEPSFAELIAQKEDGRGWMQGLKMRRASEMSRREGVGSKVRRVLDRTRDGEGTGKRSALERSGPEDVDDREMEEGEKNTSVATMETANNNKKKKHKHQPSEMSSKRRLPVYRETIQVGKREIRDPRFDHLTAGQYKEDVFKKRYAFVFDEKLPEEKASLQDAIKKAKSSATKARLKSQLSRVVQQMKNEERRRVRASVDAAEREKRREAIAAGKKPYYLKKSEKKKQELIAKYEELKRAGKLEHFMEKRRKKNAAKDHRYLPSRRNIET